ncbi:Carnosine N-methyltransferase [Cryptotermes secundus]|uniref:Carnosine N-methyltransferase n=1 Tax=Cryptotermes secundus TaxID=105785 RepID=A0A2J7PD76_9NEOP|nr:carnosine N-methyltransferase [Cryptotermes secundus]PNF14289.1 Carnosine N-methyltransferase [Cryptotermes secundus]PNF14290.1 Carnosine N-methyltransferase [Cryptotermes secundus]
MNDSSTRNTRKMRNPHDDEEEKAHFQRIVAAFKYYRAHSLQRVAKTEKYLRSLPAHHQALLENYHQHLTEIRACIENNYQIIKLIIKDVAYMFENVNPTGPAESGKAVSLHPSVADLEKVQATLKQFVRDWSEEGAQERETCYQPIVEEIVSHFPADLCVPQDVRVLVPGAGLGRLAFEIARRGYTCQGNEFSLFMLFTSNFVLNKCRGTNVYRVFPWVHQYVNNLHPEHQTQGVSFPDINPADLPPSAQFSMAAGDFLEVYTEKDEWDCISTCFFIDCANNIVAFIETIYNILKPGGLWINLGPLLYHFSDLPNENSIEPSYQVVREVIVGIGFEIEKEETHVKTTYAQNPKSMLRYEYESVFFVCRKPALDDDRSPSQTGGR